MSIKDIESVPCPNCGDVGLKLIYEYKSISYEDVQCRCCGCLMRLTRNTHKLDMKYDD